MASSDTTERRFVTSTAASYTSLAVRLVVTFVSRMVMARLVIPEAHGLYELALQVVLVASAVRDVGLPFHLMRDERKPYGTVLAFSVISGVVVTGLLVWAAPWFAVFGDADVRELAAAGGPTLPDVLRVFSLWVLIDGLSLVPKIFFERELRIDRMMLPEIVRGLVAAGLSIGLASLGWQVWAFVWADLGAALLFALLVWRRAWGTMPFRVDFSLVPSLLRHSRWLFLVWIALQLVDRLDLFVIGYFTGNDEVGFYARAYMIAFLVFQVVAPRALVPALVAYRDDPVRFLRTFRLGTVFLLGFQVVGGYYLFWNADVVVRILLGEDWGPSVALLRILCFIPFLDAFTSLGGEVLKVRREDRIWLLTTLLNLASLLTAGIWLTSQNGALGMAWANFFLAGNLLMAWRMYRVFGPGFRGIVRDQLVVYLVPLPFFLVAASVTVPGWWRAGVSVLAAAAALAVLGWMFRGAFLEFWRERGSVPPADGFRHADRS
jgi:O-antigen/teichoic acid export membrane protein